MDRIVRVSRSTWTCESDRTHQGQHSASDGYAALYPSYKGIVPVSGVICLTVDSPGSVNGDT